jgi:hypothetical protein
VIDSGMKPCIGGSGDSAVNVMNPRREMMRYSRIMAILVLLCFTFAGPSILLAQPEEKMVTFGDKEFVISYDKEKKEIKIIGETEIIKFKRDEGAVGELRLHKIGEPPQTIDWVKINALGNCEITSHHNPTCTWKFTGGRWVRECTTP